MPLVSATVILQDVNLNQFKLTTAVTATTRKVAKNRKLLLAWTLVSGTLLQSHHEEASQLAALVLKDFFFFLNFSGSFFRGNAHMDEHVSSVIFAELLKGICVCLTRRLSTASSWSSQPAGPSSTPPTPSRTTWASTRYHQLTSTLNSIPRQSPDPHGLPDTWGVPSIQPPRRLACSICWEVEVSPSLIYDLFSPALGRASHSRRLLTYL